MDNDKLRELVAETLLELINEDWMLEVPETPQADHNGHTKGLIEDSNEDESMN